MIKAFHLRDSHLVARLQRVGTPLDIEEQLTHPRSPLRSVLLDTILAPHAGPSTFILDQQDEHGKSLGLAQVRSRSGRPERDVVFMSPALTNGNGSHAIWQRLLAHVCVKTAEQGNLRVYARLPVKSEELQLFKNVGFLEYSQEDIYQLDPAINRTAIRATLTLRLQRPSDGWGLQKLYTTLAPRMVQNAEGLAQGQWALAQRRWGEQGRREGYVWEVDGEILGALHIRSGKRGYWMRTLLHPDALEQAEALGEAALSLTAAQPHVPVYFALREFEAGWRNVLPELGFKPLTSQTLVVKHMAVRVRKLSPALIPALEQTPTEGTATTVMSPIELAQTTATPQKRQARRPNHQIFTSIL
ncbi:MAG: hypothetical protein HS126_05015 [Anaerolineales bacterium]|nr:hypothetical protein [Anaerolineales bacterium]